MACVRFSLKWVQIRGHEWLFAKLLVYPHMHGPLCEDCRSVLHIAASDVQTCRSILFMNSRVSVIIRVHA